MWNLGTNSAIALGPMSVVEYLDRNDRLQNLPGFQPVVRHSNYTNPNDRPHMCSYFIINLYRFTDNEELHNLYPSPSIIRMIKSRRMRWAGHVA
jgi:hypothetical protein